MTPLQSWQSGASSWLQGDLALLPLMLPKDKISIDEKGTTVKRTLFAGYNNGQWATTIPNLYAPHQFLPGCLYRSAEIDQIDDLGDYCLVTLLYDQRYSAPTTPTPQSQFGINGAEVEEDIRRHPNFTGIGSWDANAPWSQFWDATKKDWKSDANGVYLSTVPTYLLGVTKYPVAGATVWTKVFYTSQPADPLPTGTIMDPGFGFGPSGCYLVATCDEQKENAFWYRLTHFKYSATPWPTQIINSA